MSSMKRITLNSKLEEKEIIVHFLYLYSIHLTTVLRFIEFGGFATEHTDQVKFVDPELSSHGYRA